MNSEEVTIRNLKREDIPEAMQFVLSEGWNQTENDWFLFLDNPANVCRAAEIEGKLVGTVASINYSGSKVWVSMVLVNKENRGQGISKLLLNSALTGLNSCKSIKLDATDLGLEGYRKFGFIDEYKILEVVNHSFNGYLEQAVTQNNPEPITSTDIQAVIEFDKTAFGADRTELIEYLIKNFPEKGWYISENGKIKGYALGRKGNRYHRIGPVSASSEKYAKRLISHALLDLKGKPVVIDILDEKTGLIEWLRSMNFTDKRAFTRMYQNNNPLPGRRDLLQVIAGPEFG